MHPSSPLISRSGLGRAEPASELRMHHAYRHNRQQEFFQCAEIRRRSVRSKLMTTLHIIVIGRTARQGWSLTSPTEYDTSAHQVLRPNLHRAVRSLHQSIDVVNTDEPNTIGGVNVANALRARRLALGAGGALSGALLGGIAGPPGAIAGAIMGTIIGALAAGPLHDAELIRGGREDKMDVALGIYDGDVGAPNLEHLPAKTGAFSATSSGAELYDDHAPVEGPMFPSD